MRSIYIWTTRFILAVSLAGILPAPNNSTVLVAQSKKAKASQASKYAKRGSSKAKKKDYKGALSDYKKAYQLNPTSNYKKRVQQLTLWQKSRVENRLLKNHQKNRLRKLQLMQSVVRPKLRKKIMLGL